jgi:hypothetical protein
VIQSAINALTNGGKIFIKTGEYLISSTLTPKPNILIEGETSALGTPTSKLILARNANVDMFYVSGDVEKWGLRNLLLHGNKVYNSAGNGVVATHTTWVAANLVFDNVAITSFAENGSSLTNISGNWIKNCRITSNGKLGIDLHCDDSFVQNSFVGGNGYSAISIHGSKNIISNSNFWDNGDLGTGDSQYTIGVYMPYTIIEGNVIEGGYGGNIIIGSTRDNVVSNNFISNAGDSTNPNRYGIVLYNAYRNIIVGNKIQDYRSPQYQKYAIYGSGTVTDNIIVGNEVSQNIGTPMISGVSATTNIIKNNNGYLTENSGTATFSGNGSQTTFTIAHGLAGTPKVAVVTAGSSDAKGDFYVTYDATNIYVTYATAPPSGTNNVVLRWYAEM